MLDLIKYSNNFVYQSLEDVFDKAKSFFKEAFGFIFAVSTCAAVTADIYAVNRIAEEVDVSAGYCNACTDER